MKTRLAAFFAAVLLGVGIASPGATAQEPLMITLVVDGTLNHPVTGGGSPKFVELYARENIANLSIYALSRGGNGSPTLDPLTTDFVLPNVALTKGQFYYVAGSSFQDFTIPFKDIYPALNAVRNFGVNSNGNDVTALLRSPSGNFGNNDAVVVDAFGTLGQDGIGQPWFHEDGYGLSKNGRIPSATFVPSQWTAVAQVLDGLDAAGHAAALPEGTFAIPEPGSIGLLLVGLAGLRGLRRRLV